MLTVIGVSGKAGSGKNTLVDHMKSIALAEYTDYVFELSFAQPVKTFGSTYFGEICDPVVKDPVSRKVLQGIGQMLRAEVSSVFWIDKTFDIIRDLKRQYSDKKIVVFIPDVRYKNEADALNLEHSPEDGVETFVLRIDGRTSLTGKSAEHLSETDLDLYEDFSYAYDNSSTLEDLLDFGDKMIKGIL